MTFTDLLANGSSLDLILFLLVMFAFLALILVYRKSAQKTEEMIKVLFDNTNKLKVKNLELSKKMNSFLRSNEKVLSELESKIDLLQASIGDTQGDLNKATQAREREAQRIEQRLSDFSQDIKKMQDYIREWAIDMEL